MKISSVRNFNIAFKGYDAAPLKALHISEFHRSIIDEVKEVSKKENIDLKPSLYNGAYCQDTRYILEKNNIPKLVFRDNPAVFKPHLSKIQKHYGMDIEMHELFSSDKKFIDGGNFFICKNNDGENLMLIGANEKQFLKKEDIAQNYNVKL